MALTLMEMKALFPDPMRKGVVDMLYKSSRVMSHLNFIQQPGLTYPYAQNKALPGVGFRSLNAQFTATAGVTNPAVERLAILGGKIRTDGVQIALKGDGARSNQITRQVQAAGKFFDKIFFNGDTAVNTNGFDGLKKRLSGAQLITQATNGAVPSWEKFIALQDAVAGPNALKHLFMNQATRTNLLFDCLAGLPESRLITSNPSSDPAMGMGTYYFNGSEICEVWYDETETAILPFTEVQGTSGAACSSAYCVKFGSSLDEEDVQGLSGLPGDIVASGPINFGEYLEDLIQMVGGIGLFSGYCAARLQGIKAA